MKKTALALTLILALLFSAVGGLLLCASMLPIPYTDYEVFEVSCSKGWIDELFTVPAGEHVYRDRILPNNTRVTIEFNTSAGDAIDIFVLDEKDYLRWRPGEQVANPFPGGAGVVSAKIIGLPLPHGGRWFFVWNNPNPLGSMEVSASVSVTESVTESREVTLYKPMLDQDFSYLGLFILALGTVTVVFSVIRLYGNRESNKKNGNVRSGPVF